MSKIADIGYKRLKNVLVRDKKLEPKHIENLLKSDLFSLLQNYMELENLNLNFDIINGVYTLSINANASRIKSLGLLP